MLLDFEKDSDRRISGICRAITRLILIVILMNVIHVFNISPALYPTLIVVSIISMTPTFFLNFEYAFQKIRYMVLTLLVIMAGIMYSILSYHVIIMLDEPLDTLQGVLIYGIIPRVIELIAISLICIGITGKFSRRNLRLAANIAWQHHERYDGKGYQNELSDAMSYAYDVTVLTDCCSAKSEEVAMS